MYGRHHPDVSEGDQRVCTGVRGIWTMFVNIVPQELLPS